MSVNEPEAAPKDGVPDKEPINGAREQKAEVFADTQWRPENDVRPTIGRRAVAPNIDWREERRGTLPGNRYVRVLRSAERGFTEVGPSTLRAGERATAPARVPGVSRRESSAP